MMERPHCDGQNGRESLSEYYTSCIDIRTANLLISADSGDAGAQKEPIGTPRLASAGSHHPGYGGSLGRWCGFRHLTMPRGGCFPLSWQVGGDRLDAGTASGHRDGALV